MGTLMGWRIHGSFRSSPYLAPVTGCQVIFATQKTATVPGIQVLNKCVGRSGCATSLYVSRETRYIMSTRDFYMKSLDKFVN